jgi:acyl-coenzyme A thioesterase PaaI-like protein
MRQEITMTDDREIAPTEARPPPLIRRGHPAGDFLEAWAWELLEEGDGFIKVRAHLPDRARNPRGQLFGGFTPTYVDLIALSTAHRHAGRDRPERPWLATTSMHLDYFRPILGPTFIMESRHEAKSGRTHLVLTRFLQTGELAVHATTTMRELSSPGAEA